MEKVNSKIEMEHFAKDNFKMASFQVKAQPVTSGIYTKENGKMESSMGQVKASGMMKRRSSKRYMLENINIIKNMALDSINGAMKKYLKGNGKMVK